MRIKGMMVHEIVCRSFIKLVRPVTAPMETLLHCRVGERFPGFATLIGLAVMGLCSLEVADPIGLRLLMLVVATRVYFVRRAAVRARHRGDPIYTRSAGKPWLSVALPSWFGRPSVWLDVFTLYMVACVIGLIDGTVAAYLDISAAVLLVANSLRFVVEYGRYLDALDAQIISGAPPTVYQFGPLGGDATGLPWTGGFPVVPSLSMTVPGAHVPVA